jgi:hypothetical protein
MVESLEDTSCKNGVCSKRSLRDTATNASQMRLLAVQLAVGLGLKLARSYFHGSAPTDDPDLSRLPV